MGLNLERGDIVVCALKGDYGKPRPAVVIQSDLFNSTHASLTVCPITSHLIDASLFRLPLPSNEQLGLKKASQVMIDKIVTLSLVKIRKKIGSLTAAQLNKIDHAIKIWLDLE